MKEENITDIENVFISNSDHLKGEVKSSISSISVFNNLKCEQKEDLQNPDAVKYCIEFGHPYDNALIEKIASGISTIIKRLPEHSEKIVIHIYSKAKE